MQHFLKDSSEYVRTTDVLGTYVHDAAMILHKMRGLNMEEARAFVQKTIAPDGTMPIRDPQAMVLVRQPNGDRKQDITTFGNFLKSVYKEGQMLSPSMAAYVHPDKKKSLLATYIDKNLGKRKQAKHAMFLAGQAGNTVMYNINNSKQTTFKIKNNSLSGAHSSPYTILWNKSSHSTLTSTCRVATTYGNTNNERFLYGNRHYWGPEIARNNMISIIGHTDLVKMEQVMETYGIQAPSMETVAALLKRCCDSYWRDQAEMDSLLELARTFTPVERAAFCYTGDMYHLSLVNDAFVREFFRRMSEVIHVPIETLDEAKAIMKSIDGNTGAFVGMLCSKQLEGPDQNLNFDELLEQYPDRFRLVAATAKNVLAVLDHYVDFIHTFWMSKNLPASIWEAPGMVRRGAVVSDTDSTIFTVQHWTVWYRGQLDFTKESEDAAQVAIYLAGQLIRHILATASGSMGVAKQYVSKLSMKNEYYMPVFVTTSRAKHYFAWIAAQEGNVYRSLKFDVKGVALRNSNVPPEITKKAHGLMKHIMDTVMQGKTLSRVALMRYVAQIEDGIRRDVLGGSYALLNKMQIKGRDAYKKPESSNYLHYEMWEDVFAPEYGKAPAPPYVVVKVPVALDRRTDMQEWLKNMENQAMAERFRKWLEKTGKTTMSVMLLPEQVLAMTGIPKEVVTAVNLRPLIIQTVESFYLIMEALGIYVKNENHTRLMFDEAWLLAEDWPEEELFPQVQVGEIDVALEAEADEDEEESDDFAIVIEE